MAQKDFNSYYKKILTIVLGILAISSCLKIEREAKVETGTVSAITNHSARAEGNLIDIGDGINQHGHCWSLNPNSTFSDFKTSLGRISRTGSFTSVLQDLEPGTKYYIKAYVKNEDGEVYYGGESSFTTTAISLPTITTTPITSITSTTAVTGGNISSDGGAPITARGVCWNTITDPTITLSTKTSNGTGAGSFAGNITGLTGNTTYHVRAYAINSAGTSYGNDITFKTATVIPTLTTVEVTNITSSSATSGGYISSDGGSTIISRGVCWSTTQNPTISNSHTYEGTGIGSFTSSITGLASNITYYIKAYATNIIGTAYGNQVSFTTDPVNVADLDGNVYDLVRIGTQLWMKENLKTTKFNDNTIIPYISIDSQWFSLVTPGYCWFLNDETTYRNLLGALYNWRAVNTGKLCPSGWHVPSDTEWMELTSYLIANGYGFEGSGDDIAKSLSSKTFWKKSDTPGDTGFDLISNNSSGFTALPGGYRVDEGYFGGINFSLAEYFDGTWWSSSESGDDQAWFRILSYHTNTLGRLQNNKNWGFSVRCLKD